MIDTVDCRAPRHGESCEHRFRQAGVYRYHVLPVDGDCFAPHRPCIVDVRATAPDAARRPQVVTVRCDGGHFRVEPEVVVIAPGDRVVWRSAGTGAMPFSVVGETPWYCGDRIVDDTQREPVS